MEKYIVYFGDLTDAETPVVAVKYDVLQKRLIIGGYTRFRRFFVVMLERYFGIIAGGGRAKETLTQRNKVRFVVIVNSRTFYDGMKLIEADGFVTKNVRSLQNIMR